MKTSRGATAARAARRQADVYRFLVAQLGLEAFRAAVSLIVAGQLPDAGPECAWCKYAAAWAVR